MNETLNKDLLRACDDGILTDVIFSLVHGADIDAVELGGFTPLVSASIGGHSEIVEYLLKKGANTEAATNLTNSTSLTLAFQKGYIKTVKILLRYGANPEAIDSDDETWKIYIDPEDKEEFEDFVLELTNPNVKPAKS